MKLSQKTAEHILGGTISELTNKGREKLGSNERKIAKILTPIFQELKIEYKSKYNKKEGVILDNETKALLDASQNSERSLLLNLAKEQNYLVRTDPRPELNTDVERNSRLGDIDNLILTISHLVKDQKDRDLIVNFYGEESDQIRDDLEKSKITLTAIDIKEKYRSDPEGGDPSDLFITPKLKETQNTSSPHIYETAQKNPSKLKNALNMARRSFDKVAGVGKKAIESKFVRGVGTIGAGALALTLLRQGQMPEVAQNPANPETIIQTTEMVAEQKPLGKALRPPSRPAGENKSAVATTEKSKIANTEAEAKTRVSFYRETDNNINTSVSQISEEINWDLALKVFDGFDKNKTFSTEFRRAGGYEGLKKIGAVIESDSRNGIKTVEINMPRFQSASIILATKK
jgi:hypothetical protein